MRGILHVQDLVYRQGPRLAESLSALVALERFLFGVDVAVISQVVLSPEGLATNITIEGPLVGVSPLVDEEVVRFGELSLAELADVPLLWFRRGPG